MSRKELLPLIEHLNVAIEGSGPDLVLVHGYTTTSEFWAQEAHRLSEKFRVVRFDLLGHGKSPAPLDAEYTIEAFASDVETLIGELHLENPVLAGLSMGGAIALQVALANPGLVSKLVLVSTTAAGVGPDVQAETVLRKISDVGVQEASSEVIRKSFGSTAPPELVSWAEQQVSQTPEHVAREAIQALGTFNVEDRLSSLRVDTLIVVGSEDIITPPECSQRLHDGILGSKLGMLPGIGHFPMLEDPDLFHEVLATFVEDRPGRGGANL